MEDLLLDKLGNPLYAIRMQLKFYEKTENKLLLSEIPNLKEEFYSSIDSLVSSSFTPTKKISKETISAFYRYRELDWTSQNTIQKVEGYLYSLKSH